MIAPHGEGVGGILSQANWLIEAWRREGEIDLRVIDSTQRYRENYDEAITARLLGGSVQAVWITSQLLWQLFWFRPDVVYIRSSASLGLVRDVVLATMCRFARSHVDITFHFGRVPDLAGRRNWEWRLLVLACRVARHVGFLDRQSVDAIRAACPGCEVFQFANGVPLEWIDGVRADARARADGARTPRAVFVGNVLPAKGAVELVRAAAAIRGAEFELEIVGPVSPQMRKTLVALAAARGDGSWLALRGPASRREAVERLALADVFVLPSYTEGFPVSVLEAMACGVAIIASGVGAIPQMLAGTEDALVGVLVPPRDAEALRIALQRLLTDDPLRAELGSAAREKCVRSYDVNRMALGWSDRWSRLVRGPQVTGRPGRFNAAPTPPQS